EERCLTLDAGDVVVSRPGADRRRRRRRAEHGLDLLLAHAAGYLLQVALVELMAVLDHGLAAAAHERGKRDRQSNPPPLTAAPHFASSPEHHPENHPLPHCRDPLAQRGAACNQSSALPSAPCRPCEECAANACLAEENPCPTANCTL